jgi:hypothetical protein
MGLGPSQQRLHREEVTFNLTCERTGQQHAEKKAQEVECLLSKYKALSTNPSTTKKPTKKTNKTPYQAEEKTPKQLYGMCLKNGGEDEKKAERKPVQRILLQSWPQRMVVLTRV